MDALNTLSEAYGEGYNFFTDPYSGPERTMLMRVLLGKGDEHTVAWFRHEAAEASLLSRDRGLPGPIYIHAQEKAHINVLKSHGNSSASLYHPSVVRAYDSQFGSQYPRK